MSTLELALEKVKRLDEVHARRLLHWLETEVAEPKSSVNREGAAGMLGFARRFRIEPRSTETWMKELREGEQ